MKTAVLAENGINMTKDMAAKSIQSKTITLEAAIALTRAAQAAAKDIGFEAAIAVTDAAGNLKAFERTDQ